MTEADAGAGLGTALLTGADCTVSGPPPDCRVESTVAPDGSWASTDTVGTGPPLTFGLGPVFTAADGAVPKREDAPFVGVP